MSARILDGRAIAADVLDELKQGVQHLAEQSVVPCLAFVLIGDSAPAQLYAGRLERLARSVGVSVVRRILGADCTVHELEHEVSSLNTDHEVDGILVQMPLPQTLQPARLSTLIYPRKDVDGVTVHNAGRLYLGLPGQRPSTASAMMHILDTGRIDLLGKHAVVVGRSNVVGHPISELLLHRDATLTVVHRQTDDLPYFTRHADVLVVAAGEPHLIGADMVRRGVVIVDAGINVTSKGIVGDVDFDACISKASAITPVPGGVGPVTNAVLLRSVVTSAEHRHA